MTLRRETVDGLKALLRGAPMGVDYAHAVLAAAGIKNVRRFLCKIEEEAMSKTPKRKRRTVSRLQQEMFLAKAAPDRVRELRSEALRAALHLHPYGGPPATAAAVVATAAVIYRWLGGRR
jgi:hypothetical protein